MYDVRVGRVCAIFNLVFREISLKFCEISQNTKSKFGRKFRNLAKREFGQIWAILQKRDDIFYLNNVMLFLGPNVHQNLNGF